MSIATEQQQTAMISLGEKIWAAAKPEVEAYVPLGASNAEFFVAFGQLIAQAVLGHVNDTGENGCPFIHGMGYALGSLMAQAGDPAQDHIEAALASGMIKGHQDASRNLVAQGRA